MSLLLHDYLEKPAQERIRQARRTLSRFLGEAARMVLEAYDGIERGLGHMVGQRKLLDFLAGVDSAYMREHGLDKLTHYGVFSHVSRGWVYRLIDNLKEAGYCMTQGTFRPVIVLSEEAESAIRQGGELPLLPGEILEDPVLGTLAPCNEREALLRRFRHRLGRLVSRPSREIMSDILVRDWAHQPPESKAALAAKLPARTRPHADAIWHILTEGPEKTLKQEDTGQ